MAKASITKHKKTSENICDTNEIEVAKTSATKGKRTRRSTASKEFPSQRSSIYRGVTRHRWTGRYEAHLWDKNCWSDTQKKKGKQVYLGAYDDEAAAGRAYDLAALKYWGKETILNFPLSTYENEMKEMEGLSREEYIGSLRRKSNGFSRGVSKYRGVARHHHNGRWEARIGRVFGNKYLYLGTYATQEEAATAYDLAAIQHRGPNAVTNFDLSRYVNVLKPSDSYHRSELPTMPLTVCPDNSIATSESIDSRGASTSSSSTNTTPTLEEDFEHIRNQIGHDDTSVGEMWGDFSPMDSSEMLQDIDECSLLRFSMTDGNRITNVEGQDCCSDDIWNIDENFFSDLSSFLCDFDV